MVIMFDVIFLLVLFALFVVEFVFNLLSHALVLRFATCHTLALIVFCVSQICHRSKLHKKRQRVKFLGSNVDLDTFATFLNAVGYVLIFGFVVVNILHSVQLFVHLHDFDEHRHESDTPERYHVLPVLLVAGADFLVKIFGWPVLDCGYRKSKIGRLQKATFHLAPSIVLLIIASLRCVSTVYLITILRLDPGLTIAACLIMCLVSYQPAKEFFFIFLLAAPRHVDIGEVPRLFRCEFPDISFHDLRIWRESKSRIIVSIHVRMQNGRQYVSSVDKIHEFFHALDVSRVVVQPEFEGFLESTVKDSCMLTCSC